MLRFLSFLFGKPYETCKSCETLKSQLAIANAEKKELTDTLLSLIKPKTYEAAPMEVQPIIPTVGLWSRRRDMIEASKREEAKILANSKVMGREDKTNKQPVRDIETLEQEVGLTEEKEKNG